MSFSLSITPSVFYDKGYIYVRTLPHIPFETVYKIGSTIKPRDRYKNHNALQIKKFRRYERVYIIHYFSSWSCDQIDYKLKEDKNRGFPRTAEYLSDPGGQEIYSGSNILVKLELWFKKNDIPFIIAPPDLCEYDNNGHLKISNNMTFHEMLKSRFNIESDMDYIVYNTDNTDNKIRFNDECNKYNIYNNQMQIENNQNNGFHENKNIFSDYHYRYDEYNNIQQNNENNNDEFDDYKEAPSILSNLWSMGFDEQLSIQSVQECGHDVVKCVNYIIEEKASYYNYNQMEIDNNMNGTNKKRKHMDEYEYDINIEPEIKRRKLNVIKHKLRWNGNEFIEWIGRLGDDYKQYMIQFRNIEISGDFLNDLDDNTLSVIISNRLHRKKILLEWNKL